MTDELPRQKESGLANSRKPRSRDNFSKETKEQLAKRVAGFCSNPQCRSSTSGPHTDPAGSVNIGVAAHIIAAAPGGPRGDAGFSSSDRSDISNGIWLCQSCAKLIDNDVMNVLIFGHNSAITDFVNKFGDVYIDNVPTSGLVCINFEINNWKDLKKGKTVTTLFPKELK